MRLQMKHIRASIFGLIIIFFFLPFILVSCPGYGTVSVTGIQLVTGTTIRGSQLSEVTSNQRINPEPYAYMALLFAILGILFSYIKNKNAAFVLCVIASIAGIILLLLLKYRIYIQARRLNYNEDLVIRYAIGYWLSIWGFVGALIVTILLNPLRKITFPIKIKKHSRKRRR